MRGIWTDHPCARAVWGAIWLLALSGGIYVMSAHAARAGQPPDGPTNLPSNPLSGGPLLVMIAPPACPCTRASLRELRDIVGAGTSTPVVIVFAGSAPPD